MTTTPDATAGALAAAARECGGQLHRAPGALWRVALANGRPFEVSALVDGTGEWLHLDAPACAASDPRLLRTALAANAGLPGAAKIVLAPGGLRLRAELPLDRRDALAARFAGACRGFKRALSALDGGLETTPAATCDATLALADPAGLGARCRESGWNVVERNGGRLAVTLDCPRRLFQAIVAPGASGAIVVSADLIGATALPPASAHALATLLLSIGARVRLVRAVAAEEGERFSAGLEVAFDTTPEASDLDHALSALAAACSLVGEEARVLQTEAVAIQYLALRRVSGASRPTAGFEREQS